MTWSIFQVAAVNLVILIFMIGATALVMLFKKNRKLKKVIEKLLEQNKDLENGVEKFLKNQYIQSKNIKTFLSGSNLKIDTDVKLLRARYLSVEMNAYAYVSDKVKYWKALDVEIKRLITDLMPHFYKNYKTMQLERRIFSLKNKTSGLILKSDSPQSTEKLEKIKNTLQDFYKSKEKINKDGHKMEAKLDKIEEIIEAFLDLEKRKRLRAQWEKEQYADKSMRNANTISDSANANAVVVRGVLAENASADMKEKISDFEIENNKLNDCVSALKSQLASLKYQISEQQDTLVSGDNIEDPSDEILEANEREIKRLRSVIDKQRASIMDMESLLTDLEKSGKESEEIEKLRRYIKESEMCISMLEVDLEHLKQELKKLQQGEDDGLIDERDIAYLEKQLETVQSELEKSTDEARLSKILIEFVTEAVSAATIEDLTALIFENIKEINYAANLIFNDGQRQIELSDTGDIAVKDKVVIKNLGMHETNFGENGSLSFRLSNFSGLLRPNTERAKHRENARQVVELLRISDKFLGSMIRARRSVKKSQSIGAEIEEIKKMSLDLDRALDSQRKETKTIFLNTFNQIKNLARNFGLNATQINGIHSIQEEAKAQLDADDVVRLKVRKKLLQILKRLESQK